ncbi:AraC family transcriptional regulator [soil metagenome]
MFNFLDVIKENPNYYRQLSVDELLITKYDCPLEETKVGIWSDQNYFAYVIDGKKIWHTSENSYELTRGKCIFVKKGAHIVEQFFDTTFCIVLFFLTDQFIADTLEESQQSVPAKFQYSTSPISEIKSDDTIHAFFHSIIPYFFKAEEVNKNLLELKFKELLLNVIHNPENKELTEYFCSLKDESAEKLMRKVMEDNYCYNLKLEDYARLCGKSLSGFKRNFLSHYQTTPGKWLLQKRLERAQQMIRNTKETMSEIAYECGFENVSHFSRAFKSAFGHAPRFYRPENA